MAGDPTSPPVAAPRRPRRLAAALCALSALAALAFAAGRLALDRRYHRFDPLIAEAAAEQGLEARLLWRMIRRESRFRPSAVGAAGEVGLMQVTGAAAADWARAQGRPLPSREELLDPALNVRIGAWYLARALRYWGDRDEPAVFAIAEYNAGRLNAARWAASAPDAEAFLAAITYPSTRRYIRDVLERRR